MFASDNFLPYFLSQSERERERQAQGDELRRVENIHIPFEIHD